MSTQRFDGKVCIVTGAAQGIGRATALRLAAEGGRVVIADRAEEQARGVMEEIRAAGGTASVCLADLETAEGARMLVADTRERFGSIDVAVHNVGGTIWAQPYWEYSETEIEREINRSLWPTLWCCHAVLPTMMERRRGAIVNVGSVATRGINRVPYSAAKGGVVAITTCLAMEVAPYDIRVNCVSPGGVDVGERAIARNPDGMKDSEAAHWQAVIDQTIADTPMQRFGTPDELASAIAFLASDDASYVTGETLCVSGGYKG